jgi:hypothetical protein
MAFNFLFTGVRRANYCGQLPGQVRVSVNGLYMGATDKAVYRAGTGSIGLANRGNDNCGAAPDNYIDTNQRTSWRRIDNGNTDNGIRHLVTYVDGASSRDSSRCNYCCWGCPGWREVIVWAVRPTPTSP